MCSNLRMVLSAALVAVGNVRDDIGIIEEELTSSDED